jgi:hypothetical protein
VKGLASPRSHTADSDSEKQHSEFVSFALLIYHALLCFALGRFAFFCRGFLFQSRLCAEESKVARDTSSRDRVETAIAYSH